LKNIVATKGHTERKESLSFDGWLFFEFFVILCGKNGLKKSFDALCGSRNWKVAALQQSRDHSLNQVKNAGGHTVWPPAVKVSEQRTI
jgi:hypothetical protein